MKLQSTHVNINGADHIFLSLKLASLGQSKLTTRSRIIRKDHARETQKMPFPLYGERLQAIVEQPYHHFFKYMPQSYLLG